MKTGVLGGWWLFGVLALVTACGRDAMTGPVSREAPRASFQIECVSVTYPGPPDHVTFMGVPEGSQVSHSTHDGYTTTTVCHDTSTYDPYELCTEMNWYLPHCIGEEQPQMLIVEGGGWGGGGGGGGGGGNEGGEGNEGGGGGEMCDSTIATCIVPLDSADRAWLQGWESFMRPLPEVPEEYRAACSDLLWLTRGLWATGMVFRGNTEVPDAYAQTGDTHAAETKGDSVHIDGDLLNAALTSDFAKRQVVVALVHEAGHIAHPDHKPSDENGWPTAAPFSFLYYDSRNPCVVF